MAERDGRPAIGPDQHTFVSGMTGSGKTNLVAHILMLFDNAVVLDVKGTFPAIGPRFTRLRDLSRQREGRLIYTPQVGEEFDNLDALESFFEWVYKRGNTMLDVDEVYACTKGQELPYFYKAILTRGRERNVGSISCTQRPKMVPNYIMSEATHGFIFRHRLEDDYKKLAGIFGPAVFNELPRFGYHYFGLDGTHQVGKCGLFRPPDPETWREKVR